MGNLYSTVGENIQKIRKAKKLTKKNLAKQIGVSAEQISKYEKAINKIDLELLVNICNILIFRSLTLLIMI